MFLLNLLPDFVFHLMVIFGLLGIIASQFFSFIPFISSYTTPIKIISIILLVVGVWFEGAINNNESWKQKVAELEVKVANAETLSAETNLKLQENLNEKTKVIYDKKNETIKEITKYVHDDCRLSNVAVSLHNSSSQNSVPESTIGTITGTSNVEVSEFLETVTINYSTYYEQVEKLKSWQEWYKKNKEIFENIK
jgi:cell division septum initiation protein DivIVA